MAWGYTAVAIGTTALNLYSQRQGIKASQAAQRANAADLREFAEINAGFITEAGDVNANAVLTVGEANANLIERETARSLQMYALQAGEERRLHILNQKVVAGGIRAAMGMSGVQTNTGSPLHYLHSQVKLGIQEQRYGDLKTYWSLVNIAESGADRAEVTRITAEQQAHVITTNAEMQAEISLLDAERQAEAMERGAAVQGAGFGIGAVAQLVGAGFGGYAYGGGFSQPTGNYTTSLSGYGGMYGNMGTGAFNTSPIFASPWQSSKRF